MACFVVSGLSMRFSITRIEIYRVLMVWVEFLEPEWFSYSWTYFTLAPYSFSCLEVFFPCWNHQCLIYLVAFFRPWNKSSSVSTLFPMSVQFKFHWSGVLPPPLQLVVILPLLLYALVFNYFQKWCSSIELPSKFLRSCYCPPVFSWCYWIRFFPYNYSF